MTSDLLYRLRFLSDLTEGPAGKPLFVYTDIERSEKDPPRYRSRLAIWDGVLRFLTQGEAKAPFWHGNHIYFTRKVDKANQLFRLPLSGGEPEQLTHLKSGVEGYKVSPDGSRIALLTRGDYEPPRPDEPRIYETWPVKFDARGLLPEQRRELWLWENAEARPLVKFSQDIEEVIWSTQGDRLFFTASATPQERWAWIQRAYQVGLDGRVEELFGGVGPVGSLEPTPDGGLVYLAHAWERGGGTESKLYYRSSEGEVRLLAQGSFLNSLNSDVRFGGARQTPKLGPDGRVYTVVTHEGSARLLAVTLEGQAEFLSSAEHSILGFAFCAGELYTLLENFTRGACLARGEELLYDPNAEVLPSLLSPQEIRYQAPEGHTVQGWVLLPKGDGPHPIILYIHGGPHTAFGNALMFQLQLFCAAGFAVAFCNPRGSTGYGQDFTDLGQRWGDIDEKYLLGFLDEVVLRFPLDSSRVGVAGGSYGGYMTNWLTARYPDRFKAAVTDRGICNWTSFYGASDIGPRFTFP